MTVQVNRLFIKRTPSQVTAVKAEPDNITFDFIFRVMYIGVRYCDQNDEVVGEETWCVEGSELETLLGSAAEGATVEETISKAWHKIVQFVESNSSRKETLINNERLKIGQGTIYTGLRF